MNLKEKKLQEACNKIEQLRKKLALLELSNDPNRATKIIDCKHAIQKQETVISNIKRYLKQ